MVAGWLLLVGGWLVGSLLVVGWLAGFTVCFFLFVVDFCFSFFFPNVYAFVCGFVSFFQSSVVCLFQVSVPLFHSLFCLFVSVFFY